MENKPKICKKCRKLYHCDEHHILPEKLFGEGETVPLCKNCHDIYHRCLGFKYLQAENKESIEFYYHKWYHWLYLGIFIGAMVFIFCKNF